MPHIVVECTCGKRFRAKEQAAGKRLKCPSCAQALDIPQLPVVHNEGQVREPPVQRSAMPPTVPPSSSARDHVYGLLPVIITTVVFVVAAFNYLLHGIHALPKASNYAAEVEAKCEIIVGLFVFFQVVGLFFRWRVLRQAAIFQWFVSLLHALIWLVAFARYEFAEGRWNLADPNLRHAAFEFTLALAVIVLFYLKSTLRFFGLRCPKCASYRVQAVDLIYRRLRCRDCGHDWR